MNGPKSNWRIFVVIMAIMMLFVAMGCGATGDTDTDPDGDDESSNESAGDDDTPYVPPASGLTVKDLQNEESVNHPFPGTTVTLNNVVATSLKVVISSNSNLRGFFIADQGGGEYSGIIAVMKSDIDFDPEVGDLLTITGTYVEYCGDPANPEDVCSSQIELTAVPVVTGAGAAPAAQVIANPADVATAGSLRARWEHALVKVENVTVTDSDIGYGEFMVTGDLQVGDLFLQQDDLSFSVVQDQELDSISGFLYLSYGASKLEPRNLEDVVAKSAPTDLTIADIQNPASVNHPSPGPVEVKGIVVASEPFEVSSSGLMGIFVSDQGGGAWSGCMLTWKPTSADETYGYDPPAMAPGMVIDVAGNYTEFCGVSDPLYTHCSTQIELTPYQADKGTVTDTGNTADVPAAAVVSPADIATDGSLSEQYQHSLVRVLNVTVVDNALGYGMFSVDGGLEVDDQFYRYTVPQIGVQYGSLTGFLYTSYDSFKLCPRNADDMDEGPVDGDVDGDVVDGDWDYVDGDGPHELQIRDIQNMNSPYHPSLGPVAVNNVVVTSDPFEVSSSGLMGIFVADQGGGAYTGCMLTWKPTSVDATYGYDPPVMSPGMIINVTGAYTEFCGTGTPYTYCSTQIELTPYQMDKGTVTDTGETTDVPEARLVEPGDVKTGGSDSDKWQHSLVYVQNVTVLDASLGYGMFSVDDGLEVDDQLYRYTLPAVGVEYGILRGFLYTSYDTFKLCPRSVDDMQVGFIDGDIDGDVDGDVVDGDVVDGDVIDGDVVDGDVVDGDVADGDVDPNLTTLAAIQNPNHPNHPALGPVAVNNIVVTSDPFEVSSSGLMGIIISEGEGGPWQNCMLTWKPTSVDATYGYDPPAMSPGMVIDVTGSYAEFCGTGTPYTYCSTQIELTPYQADKGTVTDTGSTASVPAAISVSTGDVKTGGTLAEQWQHALITVSDVFVTDNSVGYGQFLVTDNLVSDALMVDDQLYYYTLPEVEDYYDSLTGFLYTSYNDFKLIPRNAADMVEFTPDGDGVDGDVVDGDVVDGDVVDGDVVDGDVVDGDVVTYPAPGVGEVIFTEFMANPAVLADSNAEWIELVNLTSNTFGLGGMYLCDSYDPNCDVLPDSLVIEPNGRLLFVKSDNSAFNGGLQSDFNFGFDLNNTGDVLRLYVGDSVTGTLIDSVDFTGWTVSSGVANQLDPSAFNATDNDDQGNWCAATSQYEGTGPNLGTPNGDNLDCDAVDGDVIDGDVIDGDVIDGDMIDGDMIDGDMIDGDMVDGDVADCYGYGDCNSACIGAGYDSGMCVDAIQGCACNYDSCSGYVCGDYYDNCSCAAADPCSWQGDDYCDDYCAVVYPDDHFDDSADCSVDGDIDGDVDGDVVDCYGYGDCNSACIGAGYDSGMCVDAIQGCACNYDSCSGYVCGDYYDNCSCAAADPCSWQGDDYCDDYCAVVYPDDHFDDTADCSVDGDVDGDTVDGDTTTYPLPGVGDVIFTEFHPNPNTLSDNNAEFVEVLNLSGDWLSLGGLNLCDSYDGNCAPLPSDLNIGPNARLLFARSSDTGLNGGLTVDAVFDFGMNNDGDQLRLIDGDPTTGTVIDSVDFDAWWITAGAAWQLDPSAYDATMNDDEANWCLATNEYEATGPNYGTPGVENDDCPVIDGDVVDGDIVPTLVTIYEIQNPDDAGHPSEGPVAVNGLVITSDSFVISSSSGLTGVFASETAGGPWSGILLVWTPTASDANGYDPPAMGKGDSVNVVGDYVEYCGGSGTYTSCSTQIELTALVNTGMSSPVPVATTVDAADIATGGSMAEQYQFMLVQVENVEVTDNGLGYGEFTVTGGLRVDDSLYSYTLPANGVNYDTLAGYLYTSYNDFKLLPRDANDMVETLVDGDTVDGDMVDGDAVDGDIEPSEVVINELYYDSDETSDNANVFIELYGIGDLSLSGYSIVAINGSNGDEYSTTDLTGQSIPADGFFVLADSDSGVTNVANADMVSDSVDYQNGADTVQLRYNGTTVDALAYGTGVSYNAGEGTEAQDVGPGMSLARNPDGSDTNDNATDFAACSTPTPGASNASCFSR